MGWRDEGAAYQRGDVAGFDLGNAIPAHRYCARCREQAPADAARLGPRAWVLSPILAESGETIMLAFCPECSPMRMPDVDRLAFEEWDTGTGPWRRR